MHGSAHVRFIKKMEKIVLGQNSAPLYLCNNFAKTFHSEIVFNSFSVDEIQQQQSIALGSIVNTMHK